MMQDQEMAEQNEELDDQDSEQENQELESEPNDRDDQDEDSQENDDSEDDDLVATFGDESPTPQKDNDDFQGKPAPSWVKELRKENRELKKQLKQNQQTQQPQHQEITLAKKPKLEDFDYDAEEYEKARDAWDDQKRLFEKQEERKKAEQDEASKTIEHAQNAYKAKAKALKAKDFDDAEYEVQDKLSATQQGIILTVLDDSAKFVYVLGKNPEKLKELASISDPLKFTVAAAKLETQMKVTKRKAATQPERTVKGSGSLSGAVDSTYEKLVAKAEKTGDRTEVIRYLRQKQRN